MFGLVDDDGAMDGFGTLVENDGGGMRFAVRGRRLRGFGDAPTVMGSGTPGTNPMGIGVVGTVIKDASDIVGALFGQTPSTSQCPAGYYVDPNTRQCVPASAQTSWLLPVGLGVAGIALFMVLSKKRGG